MIAGNPEQSDSTYTGYIGTATVTRSKNDTGYWWVPLSSYSSKAFCHEVAEPVSVESYLAEKRKNKPHPFRIFFKKKKVLLKKPIKRLKKKGVMLKNKSRSNFVGHGKRYGRRNFKTKGGFRNARKQ